MTETVLLFQSKSIRCLEQRGEMWFCGKDVCDVLGYAIKSHKNALHKVSNQNKQPYSFFKPTCSHNDGLVIYLSEYGVIELTVKCKFQAAKPFQAFVQQTIKDLRESKLTQTKTTLEGVTSKLAIKEKEKANVEAELQHVKDQLDYAVRRKYPKDKNVEFDVIMEELKPLYDVAIKLELKVERAARETTRAKHAWNLSIAHKELESYVHDLQDMDFFNKYKRELELYNPKFWENYNGLRPYDYVRNYK